MIPANWPTAWDCVTVYFLVKPWFTPVVPYRWEINPYVAGVLQPASYFLNSEDKYVI